ncbi:putative iron-regulated protein [Roseicyclus mahoneyensis]|uniref:Putative iron-regulated protein n=1 Tax=Roseicyclus mahoneyensis TaxID=164332 RepID=A0A316GIW7_9RHOB|nr:putative iron-regulated protein [Roseicyclus mahoneyensis]
MLLGGLAAFATDAAAQATAQDVVAAAEGAQIVILGEVHDNPGHHAVQAEVMAGLGPSAIVFEMISAEGAARVTPDVATDPVRLADLLDWANSGWPDFAFYAPLFAFGAEVPIYGAQIDRNAAQGAFAEGAAAVFTGDAARFGLEQPLPAEEQEAREAEQLAAHCDALPPEILPGFVEAQRLRDAALAEAALAALAAHGAPVVIITGTGHARRDWGVPAVLAVAAPGTTVFSLGQFEVAPQGDVPFDLWALSDPVDRPDPCAGFR